jgi:hypothetical protein
MSSPQRSSRVAENHPQLFELLVQLAGKLPILHARAALIAAANYARQLIAADT